MKNKLSWTTLNSLGRSRILKSSYLWLLVVPVVAKLLENVGPNFEIQIFGKLALIELSLPFSWVVFFFSAVAISAADLIYNVFCPKLIKDHQSFSGFKDSGNGRTQLKKYYEGIVADGVYGEIPRTTFAGYDGQIDHSEELQNEFWDLYYYAESCRVVSRFACGAFYIIGLTLILFIFIQNIRYVLGVA
jgi:hypothetical protein